MSALARRWGITSAGTDDDLVRAVAGALAANHQLACSPSSKDMDLSHFGQRPFSLFFAGPPSDSTRHTASLFARIDKLKHRAAAIRAGTPHF